MITIVVMATCLHVLEMFWQLVPEFYLIKEEKRNNFFLELFEIKNKNIFGKMNEENLPKIIIIFIMIKNNYDIEKRNNNWLYRREKNWELCLDYKYWFVWAYRNMFTIGQQHREYLPGFEV